MNSLSLRRMIAAVCSAALLCGCLSGCDEIFQPVEETGATDPSNPYIYWDEPVTDITGPTEPTEPEEEGELAYVSGKMLNIRSGPGTQFEVLGVLYLGNQVRILEQRAVDGALWGLTEIGWVSMEYISFDNAATPYVTATITAKELNIRSGAGTNYEVVGMLRQGDQVRILEQTYVSNKAWGRTSDGWISLEYAEITESVVGTKIGVVSNSYVNVRSGAGFGYDTIGTLDGGYELYITEEVFADGLNWGHFEGGWVCMDYIQITGVVASTPEQNSPSGPSSNAVADTSIVGNWISIEEESYFSGGKPSPTSWTFHEDGTFSYSKADYAYMENVGWQGTGNASTTQGTYTFDGSTLTFTGLNSETTMSVSITDNTMEVYGHRTYSLMLRTYDANALIKVLIRRDRSSSDSSICGSWTSINTSTYSKNESLDSSSWYFGTDGSFSQTVSAYAYSEDGGWKAASGSYIYSGVYFFDGSRLTLCYETKTNGSNWETDADVRYVILENILINGNIMEMKDLNLYGVKDGKIADVAAALG